MTVLKAFVIPKRLGEVFFAPLPIRLRLGQLREPDVVFVGPDRIPAPRQPPDGADLVMEVVSEGFESRERDLKTKRREYAKAKIAEYWIVDPDAEEITVLTLSGSAYRVHGKFKAGTHATSVRLKGFVIDVTAAFEAGNRPATS